MLPALNLLLVYQLVGEVIAQFFALPVPGPVIGMALLFLAWPWLGRWQARLEQLSTQLLANFGLLFVPAGVGVMVHAHLLSMWWPALLAAVAAGTLGTLALGAWLMQRLSR